MHECWPADTRSWRGVAGRQDQSSRRRTFDAVATAAVLDAHPRRHLRRVRRRQVERVAVVSVAEPVGMTGRLRPITESADASCATVHATAYTSGEGEGE